MLDGLAEDLREWKRVCSDPSPTAFMFPNAGGGLFDPGNYSNRVVKALAKALELTKLTFQVLRPTMATRGHKIKAQ